MVLWPSEQPPKGLPPPPASTSVEVRLIPKAEADLQAIRAQGDTPGINGAPDPRICAQVDATYEGIGIIHDIGSMAITSAPATYPGYKAGLRVGDVINEISAVPNTNFLIIGIDRDGRLMQFKIKMEKICYEGGSR